MVRWSLVVNDDTDRLLRTFLAQTGGRKGDLSNFVERAVKSRLFELTVDRIKERNEKLDQQEMMNAIDEAVMNARAPHH